MPALETMLAASRVIAGGNEVLAQLAASGAVEDVATAGKTDLGSTIAVFLSVVIIGESGDGDVVKSVMNATKASSSVSWAAVRRLLIAMPA
jgi:hypothetical protein